MICYRVIWSMTLLVGLLMSGCGKLQKAGQAPAPPLRLLGSLVSSVNTPREAGAGASAPTVPNPAQRRDAPRTFDLSSSGLYASAIFPRRGLVWWKVGEAPKLHPLPAFRREPSFPSFPDYPDVMQWSPDDRSVVGSDIMSFDTGLYSIPDGRLLWRTKAYTAYGDVWMRGGETLSVQKRPETTAVSILDARTGRELRVLPGLPWIHAWSPAGDRLLTTGVDKNGVDRSIIRSTEEFGTVIELDSRIHHVGHGAWSPDGSAIALGVDYAMGFAGPFAWIVDATTGKVLHTFQNYNGATWYICWSPDSRLVLFQETGMSSPNGESRVRVYDRQRGRLLAYLVWPRDRFLGEAIVQKMVWPAGATGPTALVSHLRGIQIWRWPDLQKRLDAGISDGPVLPNPEEPLGMPGPEWMRKLREIQQTR